MRLRKKHSTAAAIAAIALMGALSGCSLVNNVLNTVEGKTDVFSLAVGDCTNDPSESVEEVDSVVKPSCTDLHDNEIYLSFTLNDGDYPGDNSVIQSAEEGCGVAFLDFVGATLEETSLDYASYYPTAESWANGDREILCIAYDTNGQVSEPLAGKGPEYPY